MTKPKARTRNVDGRRHYVAQFNGVEYLIPSASTLAGQLDKPAIAGWDVNRHIAKSFELAAKAKGLDVDEFKALVRAGVRRDGSPEAESGSRAHRVIELVLTGCTVPDLPEAPWASRHAEAIQDEMKLRPLQVTDSRTGVELTVARVEDDIPIWAGTADFIGEWIEADGFHAGCVDWKSGASGLWADSILSTSVYSGATHWIDDVTSELLQLPKTLDSGALVWVRPEGWAWCPINADETAEAIEICRSLAVIQRWRMLTQVAEPVNADPIFKQ